MSVTDVVYTCDACGKDITDTGYECGYRLVLRSEGKRGYGGAVYSSPENLPYDTQHFCDLQCLERWMGECLAARRKRASEEADRLEEFLASEPEPDPNWLLPQRIKWDQVLATPDQWRKTLARLRKTAETYL